MLTFFRNSYFKTFGKFTTLTFPALSSEILCLYLVNRTCPGWCSPEKDSCLL